jgi:hypothetical protein
VENAVPHNTRHSKKIAKPKRRTPLGITDPEALALHRELAALRIAGRAKPGKHRDELLKERFRKLDESREQRPTKPEVPGTQEPPNEHLTKKLTELKEKFDRRAGR